MIRSTRSRSERGALPGREPAHACARDRRRIESPISRAKTLGGSSIRGGLSFGAGVVGDVDRPAIRGGGGPPRDRGNPAAAATRADPDAVSRVACGRGRGRTDTPLRGTGSKAARRHPPTRPAGVYPPGTNRPSSGGRRARWTGVVAVPRRSTPPWAVVPPPRRRRQPLSASARSGGIRTRIWSMSGVP